MVSRDSNEELVALGLGSCIGLAILDRTAGVAGLAHIVLPESSDRADQVGKFADTAVPELIARMRSAGATERRFETAIVGGARMFEMSGGLDIGARNEAAVRAALSRARIPINAAQTGGSSGRTMKVAVGEMLVTVREAGQQAETLLEGRAGRVAAGAGAAR
ncbi:MAG TPA: chemotaxis protein CheD [Solirubrobacteraceae bacterium]